MASSSASGSKLAELEEELKSLMAQKAAALRRVKGTRDLEVLGELNKDFDQTQTAITALSSGELHFLSQLLPYPLFATVLVANIDYI